MLTAEDLARIKTLHLAQLVDLRSTEERQVAPTKIMAVAYTAVGYSIGDISHGVDLRKLEIDAKVYRQFPALLAPHLRVIFRHMLREHSPIAFNCSAGQDRTGFVTAVILSALGVKWDTIVQDYYLTPRYRHVRYEMPPLRPGAFPGNVVAEQMATEHSDGDVGPARLNDANGPFLAASFEEIATRWGSIDGYLTTALGLSPTDIAALRDIYLE